MNVASSRFKRFVYHRSSSFMNTYCESTRFGEYAPRIFDVDGVLVLLQGQYFSLLADVVKGLISIRVAVVVQ